MSLALPRLVFSPAAINFHLLHHPPDNPPTHSPTLGGGGGIRVRRGADHHALDSSFDLNLCLDESIPFDPKQSTQNRCRNTGKRVISPRTNFGRTSFATAAAAAAGSDHGEGDGGAADRGGSRSSAGDGLFSIAAQCLLWSYLLILVGQMPVLTFSSSVNLYPSELILVKLFLTIWLSSDFHGSCDIHQGMPLYCCGGSAGVSGGGGLPVRFPQAVAQISREVSSDDDQGE
ncbi:unnamed protein product [Linum trigynum]|uniref:Uncharacterized protein n=1 Tax=Linum trigynum TaxID=586398 RepID=A0AAV2FHY6_9ROSI